MVKILSTWVVCREMFYGICFFGSDNTYNYFKVVFDNTLLDCLPSTEGVRGICRILQTNKFADNKPEENIESSSSASTQLGVTIRLEMMFLT